MLMGEGLSFHINGTLNKGLRMNWLKCYGNDIKNEFNCPNSMIMGPVKITDNIFE